MLIPAIAGFALYFPILGYEFVLDDRYLITNNGFMRGNGYLGHLLLSDFWASTKGVSGFWRPLVTLSYWIDGRLGNWSAPFFHGVNLVAHAGACSMLAAVVLAAGLGSLPAAAAGVLFAGMPAHVESVAWISGRTDVFAAWFALAALLLDRRAITTGSRSPAYGVAACLACALVSKESSAAIVLALVVQRGIEQPLRRLAELWPCFAVLVLWAVSHALVVGSMPPTDSLSSPAVRLASALAAPAEFLIRLWPGALHSPDYMMKTARSLADPRVWAGVSIHVIGLASLIVLLARRHGTAIPVAILWLPLAALTALIALNGTLFYGERHLYLASAGAAWLAAYPLASWPPRSPIHRLASVAFVAVALWSAWECARVLPVWKTTDAVYAAMAVEQPHNPTGLLGQGFLLLERGHPAEALAAFDGAETLDPTRHEAALFRARALIELQRYADGAAEARRALSKGANARDARLLEALAFQQLGRFRESGPLLDTLRRTNPLDGDVQWASINQLVAERRFVEAETGLRRWLDAHPDDGEARQGLAAVRDSIVRPPTGPGPR